MIKNRSISLLRRYENRWKICHFIFPLFSLCLEAWAALIVISAYLVHVFENTENTILVFSKNCYCSLNLVVFI